MVIQRLDVAAGVRPKFGDSGDHGEDRGKVLKTYRWFQFAGQEHTTEFDEAHFALEGQFSQNSSVGHKDYQDRLRAVHLRKEGMDKAAIAKAIGRSEKFVAKWWQKEKDELKVPYGVHAYLTKDMGKNKNGVGATSSAVELDASAMDAATHWRDVEVRREFAVEPEIYDEIVARTDWKSSAARTRDFATGGDHAKYDRYGKMRMFGHQGGKYEKGVSPALDKCMQRLFAEYGIADRTSGVITNWYPDGDSYLGSHRHDCWTALFSFGHERILTLDNTPLLMQHGDLVIFGTQRHGVPFMPEVKEGRITVVVFFYPDAMQKKMMWQTITDPETMAPSRPFVSMLKDHHLGTAAEQRAVESRPEGELKALLEFGFHLEDAQRALQSSGFDLERAVELLLLAGKGGEPSLMEQGSFSSPPALDTSTKLRSSGWRNRARAGCVSDTDVSVPKFADNGSNEGHSANSSVSSTAAGSSTSPSIPNSTASSSTSSATLECQSCEDDESLARRLYFEEAGGADILPEVFGGMSMSDAEIAALAVHFDEVEAMDSHGPIDSSLLRAQFEEYDVRLKLEDAEQWNGTGDLMLSGMARENLTIEGMEKVCIYSIGHGDMLEKDFWEMLQCHSIRVMYDIRPTDYRGELYSRHKRFSVASLRASCRARGIIFKSMPIGKESAYGTLAHIHSDEGKHTLVEIVWQAKRKHTAFLGSHEVWREDARQVAADVLARAGHTVLHVHSDGSVDRHENISEFPDWLVREEERLRLVEKKRQAGELGSAHKSRVDRSSEAVASKLARPVEEVDAMTELKAAANQKELVVAQRKLARYQRLADEKGILAKKVVTSTPEWVLEDARKQAEWVARKKTEKAMLDGGASQRVQNATTNSAEVESSVSSMPGDGHHLYIECFGCNSQKPWPELELGDGFCTACIAGAADLSPCASEGGKSEALMGNATSTSAEEVAEATNETVAVPRRSAWRGRRSAASKGDASV